MAESSPLDILSSTSRLSGLSPDAMSSLNALAYKLASEREGLLRAESDSEPNDESFKRFLKQANHSRFLD